MVFLPVSEISYGNFVPSMESKEMSKKRKRPDQEIKGDPSFSWGWRVRTSSILELNLKQINKIWKRPRSNRVGKVDDGYKGRVRPSCCTPFFPDLTERSNGNKDRNLDQAKEFCDKVMKETTSEDYLKILKWLDDYGTGKISIVDVKIMIAAYFLSFMDDFDRLVEFYGYKKKPEEERLTENYYLLRKDVRGVHNPGATELEKQVINSWCHCKGSYGVGAPKTISPAEKRLNQREDELFRMDMLKRWKLSTEDKATKLFNAITDGLIQEPTMEDVNRHFTATNFKFIAKMYGDRKGLSMVDELRHAPTKFLPELIQKLKSLETGTMSTWSLD